MKRPAFQFYPADWRKDPALSTCSLAARGLWIELMCVAHESDEYGVLSINGKQMNEQQIARTVGETPSLINKLIRELEAAGVFSRNEQGSIFSRRMIKDEHLRNIRADAGRLGGNPNLLNQNDKQKPHNKVNQNQEQILTPSSSSSFSSSSETKSKTIAPLALLASLNIDAVLSAEFIAITKTKKKPLTERVLRVMQSESIKAGLTLQQALNVCCEKGWARFEAEWMTKDAVAKGSQSQKDQAREGARKLLFGDKEREIEAI